MKRILSFVLAFVFVIGICASAPIIVNAASADDLVFELNEDQKSYSVIYCKKSAKGEVVIPSTYNGLPVTEIGEDAFYDCIRITSVVIPDSVKRIGNSAFEYCESLQSVKIPDTVESIGYSAFYGTGNYQGKWVDGVMYVGNHALDCYDSKEEIVIKDGTKTIAEWAFMEKASLRSVKLPTSLEYIGERAFEESAIESIVIPDGVKSLPYGLFWNCRNLASVTLPKTLTNIGEDAFMDCGSLASITIPQGVKVIGSNAFTRCPSLASITIPQGVTSIGAGAFYECTALEDISLPKGMNVIGAGAFNYTAYSAKDSNWENGLLYIGEYLVDSRETETNKYTIKNGTTVIGGGVFSLYNEHYWVEAVEIPDSVIHINHDAFSGASLESITLPKNLETVGDYAFDSFSGFDETITLPQTLKSIGSEAFSCYGVDIIEVPASVTEIMPNAFGDCGLQEINVSSSNTVYSSVEGVLFNKAKTELLEYPEGKMEPSYTIPSTVTVIGESAFADSYLENIDIPDSVKTIKDRAFCSCYDLSDVSISDSVTYIGDFVFMYCSALETINIPKKLTRISNFLFEGTGIKNIEIPSSVVIIGSGAFEDCNKLESITIPNGVKIIGVNAFSEYSSVDELSPAKDIVIPDSVLSIKYGAFQGTNIKSVKIGDSVEEIGLSAFADCPKLKTVTFGKNLKKIDWYAFQNDTALTEIVIPESVEYIGGFAFHNCTALQSVKVNNAPVEIGGSAFENCSALTTADLGKNLKNISSDIFLSCAKLTNVNLGEEIKNIDHSSFKNCSSLEAVVIPDTVEKIENSAFEGCTNLKTVTFSKNVKDVYSSAFAYCTNLETVNYKGSEEDWKKIRISDFNEPLLNAKKVYSEIEKTLVLATPTATTSNTAQGIKITWGAVENAEKYVVYQRIYNKSTKKYSSWKAIKTTTDTSYVDTSVKIGTGYSYAVRAVNGTVKSKYVATKGLTYNVTPTVKLSNASNGIKVTWTKAANATGYAVYSSTYNAKTKKWSGWKLRGTAKATAAYWTDTKVQSGTIYKYTVRACNGSVKGNYNKSGVSLTRLAQPTTKIANTATGIKVSWSKVAGATGYRVYRSEIVDGKWTSWKTMGTAKSTASYWVDRNAVSGTTYRYTVRAVRGSVSSSYKATSSLMYLAQPTVTVKAQSNGFNVSWSESEGATSYVVYRRELNTRTNKFTSWKAMVTLDSENATWLDTSAKKDVTYRYTVRAVNGNYKSTYSAGSNVKR